MRKPGQCSGNIKRVESWMVTEIGALEQLSGLHNHITDRLQFTSAWSSWIAATQTFFSKVNETFTYIPDRRPTRKPEGQVKKVVRTACLLFPLVEFGPTLYANPLMLKTTLSSSHAFSEYIY